MNIIIHMYVHGKDNFTDVFKTLADVDLKIIFVDH